MTVLVDVGEGTTVFVLELIITAVDDAATVGVLVSGMIFVGMIALGVWYKLTQIAFVRMAGSMGSMKSLGRLVRKSLFGSILDSILVFSFHFGAKRIAHCPARLTHRNPKRRMTRMMIQSRRSRFWDFSS